MKIFFYCLGLLLALTPNLIFTLTLKYWPTPSENHIAFGTVLLRMGETEAALKELREAVQLHPGEEERINLGMGLMIANQLPEAATQFQEALSINPQNIEARSDLGLVLALHGQVQDGIKEFEETLRIAPNDEKTRFRLGQTLFQIGRKEEGLEQFRIYVQADPSNPEGRFYYGNALLQTGRDQEAVVQFEEALKLSPGNQTLEDSLDKAKAALSIDATK